MSYTLSPTTSAALDQLLSDSDKDGETVLSLTETCYAILIAEGLGRLKTIPAETRATVVTRLSDSQSGDGLFTESNASGAVLGKVSAASLRQTYLALHALNALGAVPKHPFAFLERFPTVGAVFDWAVPELSHPVRSSELLMCLLTCLVCRAEVAQEAHTVSLYHAILDEVDSRQDRTSGFWLEDAAGPLALRVWAASHLAPFFGYVHRPLLQAGRKIDLLLEILATGSPGGEIVADSRETYVGATYLLAMMRNFTNYRSSQVEESLHKAVKQLASFPPTASPIAVASIFTESLPDGDESPRIHALHLDWTTLSAVAAAQGAQRGANPGWNFRKWPGLNHYWQRGVLNSHQSDVIGLWARRPAAASPPATAPSRPRVAVIIPCHNLGIYLPEALESVFAQTAQNIEIVVVDDGSTDEITRRLLELVCGRTVRLIQQTNQGLAAARNAGIRACTAEYVCCLDPDDKLTAEFLERALKILEDQPDAGFVSTSYKTFDEREDLVAHASCGFPELLAENCAMVSSLFRKVAWERAGGYYGGFPVPGFEDWDLWITFVEQGWRAHVMTEPLFLYRVRPDSMYRSAGSDSGKLEQTFHILAQRHRDSYQRHAPEVVAKVRVALTRLQDFIRFEGQARAWSDNQLDRWQAIANMREQSMFSLAQRIDQLEMGKRWLTAQVESWKEEHRKCQEVIQLQKGWIEDLERGKRWLEEQHALLKAKSETGTPERPNETGGDRDVEI